MSPHFGSYPHHADTLHCPRCGKRGSIVWEDVPHPGGEEKEFVRIEGEFFERIAARSPHPIELVCGTCGTIQSEPADQGCAAVSSGLPRG